MNTEQTTVVSEETAAPVEVQASDDSFDLSSYRSERSETPAESSEEPADETVSPDASQEDESAAASGPADETESDEPEGEVSEDTAQAKKGKGGFQKRITKLTSDRDALKAENDALKAQLAGKPAAKPAESAPAEAVSAPAPAAFDKPKPTLEECESIEDFTDKLLEWKDEKKTFESGVRERADTAKKQADEALGRWNTRKAQVEKAHPDFAAKMDSVADITLPAAHQALIFESEHGPQLAYALASNRAELQRIAGLDPLAAAKAIGKLELSLTPSAAPKPATKVSGAPAPIRPVGGAKTAAGRVDVASMTSDDYRRARLSGRLS